MTPRGAERPLGGMGNVLKTEKQEQVRALGRLGWSLRRIQDATGVHRDTVRRYLEAAEIPIREPRKRGLGTGPTSKPASDPTADPEQPPRTAAVRPHQHLHLEHPLLQLRPTDDGGASSIATGRSRHTQPASPSAP